MNEQINEEKEKRARDSRKLKWYERQYGAGFVAGLWVGVTLGTPLAFVIYQVAKSVVHFIEGA